MNAEARFVLAVVLMLGVLVGGNLLFPPAPPPEGVGGDPSAGQVDEPVDDLSGPESPSAPVGPTEPARGTPDATAGAGADAEVSPPDLGAPGPELVASAPPREIVVEGPLYRMTLSSQGARITAIELLAFESFTREGPVQLVDRGDPGLLGARVIVEGDTLDLRNARFETSSVDRVRLQAGGEPQVVELEYADPAGGPVYRVAYTFHADTYLVEVRGTVEGVGRGILMTDLGWGLAYNEVDEASELRSTAYVVNHLQRGIRATSLSDVSERTIEDGPFLWVASKSRYFVVGLLPPLGPGGGEYLGGVAVGPLTDRENRAALAVTQSVGGGGFEYQVYAGPQDYQQLAALGNDFQEVSPVGWRWLRPVLRPIVAGIMWVLVFFHVNLSIGYGWVLVLVGVLMRIVLFPLNHKAMRAQLKNMAVQPLLKDIQTRYKDQPERMQKELMKLYREHGFNPLAGCWPILLPWPVLIALFFVFQNTIELRGVPFAWLPDLSAKDPIFVLPLLLGVSMFLLQWISMRAVEDASPQMKMMLWTMPIVMVVIFVNFPSGLNLYYLTANIATLPQSWWIARERKRVQAVGPPSPAKG